MERTQRNYSWRELIAVVAVALPMIFLAGCARDKSELMPPSPAQQLFRRDPRGFAQAIVEQFDVDGDGQISADEFALATIQMFGTADKSGDLKLDREELGPVSGEMLSSADTNRDGMLSLSEIIRDQDRQFEKYDSNRDEDLTLDELERFAADRLSKQQMK